MGKSDGIQGLYRGFTISAVGIFIYRGMYFGMFDNLKPMLIGDGGSVGLSFLLGWGVTVTAGLMSYPIDTIRRRMMMTSGGSGVKYAVRSSPEALTGKYPPKIRMYSKYERRTDTRTYDDRRK